MKAAILTLVFTTFSLQAYAEVVTREYSNDLHTPAWVSTKSAMACHLSQKIPLYGEIIFSHRADDKILGNVWVFNPPERNGYARLYSIPPEWKSFKPSLDLGRIAFMSHQRPFAFNHQMARRLMKELELGNWPTIYYEDWQDSLDDIKVAISPVGFRKVIKEHQKCIASLDPIDYDAMTTKVSFKNIDETESSSSDVTQKPAAMIPTNDFIEETGETVVYFETNKTEIRDAARKTLNVLVDYLATHPEQNLLIVTGHTDNRGSDELNLSLGENRAKAVNDYLVKNGIDPAIIQVMSEGERSPVASNKDPQGQARNRRTHIMPHKQSESEQDKPL